MYVIFHIKLQMDNVTYVLFVTLVVDLQGIFLLLCESCSFDAISMYPQREIIMMQYLSSTQMMFSGVTACPGYLHSVPMKSMNRLDCVPS